MVRVTVHPLVTKNKDLVDLVAIVTGASVEAERQSVAITSEATRRGFPLPNCFEVPDRSMWGRGYRAEAARSLLPIAHTLEDALSIIGPFIDPILDGNAQGRWDPQKLVWEEFEG
jgi:hypothetical protein